MSDITNAFTSEISPATIHENTDIIIEALTKKFLGGHDVLWILEWSFFAMNIYHDRFTFYFLLIQ